jgi:hypothetical protein
MRIMLEVEAKSSLGQGILRRRWANDPVHIQLADDVYELLRWTLHSDGTVTTWWWQPPVDDPFRRDHAAQPA